MRTPIKMSIKNEVPLCRVINYAAHEIRNMAERILHPYGLTVEQMHLLRKISVNKGITQKELSDMANKTPANLTRILDRLETKSLVVKHSDPRDRRVWLVFLTDSGQAIMREAVEAFEFFSQSILRGISDEMQELVTSCLEMIGENIEQMKLELKK